MIKNKSLGSRLGHFLGVFRTFTSSCNLSFNNPNIKPSVTAVVKYDNADTDKAKFFHENRDKSAVYR